MTFYQDHLRFWIWVSGCRIQVNSFPCQQRLPWDVFLSVCFFFPPFCLLQHKDTGVQRLKRRNSGDDVAKCYRLVYLTCKGRVGNKWKIWFHHSDLCLGSWSVCQRWCFFPNRNERAEWRFLKHRDLCETLYRLLITADSFIKHSVLHRWWGRWGSGVGWRRNMPGHLTRTLLGEISLWAET